MTAEKTRATAQLNDITECCICLKTFTDPRMLPCIHTFCFQCLNEIVDKSDKKPGDAMPCPVCRKELSIPKDGIQSIQKNFFMTSMIEVRNALNQSKVAAIPCDICKATTENPTEKVPEATNLCLVCQENLCESCCKMHKTFKVSKDHEIVKIRDDVPLDVMVKNLQTINCDIHRKKVLDYYCTECKKVVCVSCFVESHRLHDCKDVSTVEEEFRNIIGNSASVISTLSAEILAKKNKPESRDKFLLKMAEREEEILQRSEELKEMIDKQTKSLLNSLEEIKNRHLKDIQTEEDELDRRLIILESFSRYCNELRSNGSASDVCRSKDELLRRADELEEDHEMHIMHPLISFDVTFQVTDFDDLSSGLRSANIVGKVKENTELLEDFIVAIGESDGDVYSYQINLDEHGQGNIVSSMQNAPVSVRPYHAAAVCENTMFIIGLGKAYNKIWKFDLTSGWKKCGSLVEGRRFHCTAFLGKTLYICGGSKEGIVVDSIEAYNVLTEQSTIVGHLKFGSKTAACVAYKGSIYVFGGEDKDKKALDCVQVYSPVDKICTLLSTSMPHPERFLRSMLWGSYAILLNSSSCFIFDIEKKTFHERNQFKTDVSNFHPVFVNERIFVIGGTVMEELSQPSQDAEKYKYRCIDEIKYTRASSMLNNETAKWKTLHHLPKAIAVYASAKLSLVK